MRYEKEQTVVDWFIKELGEYFPWGIGGIEYLIKQAKEMEREQMIDTYLDGDKMEGRATLKDAEEYYDKKFNTKSEPSKQ